MRVLIINTSEKTGGAAIAARRLMESLHTAGTDVKMLVLHKESQSKQVIPVGVRLFGKGENSLMIGIMVIAALMSAFLSWPSK